MDRLKRGMVTLLAEIEGKTQIWYSLNLSYDQKIMKMVNFLHEEGIDAKTFDVFKEK